MRSSVDVLIVDDDRLNLRLLERYVRDIGYATRCAETGERALELYAEALPDVVLLDVMMPGIDGYETARRMKDALRDDYVPILILSALSTSESVAEGLAAGADDFLTKPYNRTVLKSRLQAALRTKTLFNRIAAQKSELQTLQEGIHKDQEVAERVMAGMIRSDLLSAPFIKYRSVPASRFNGDLLMAETTPEGRIRVMLADFAGHGLAAAVGGQPVASIFRSMTDEGAPVAALLEAANAQLKSFLPPELFLAVCIIEIDARALTMSVWNAGMPEVLVRRAAGGIKATFASEYVPLGIVGNMDVAPAEPLSLASGDRVYLHSDGFTEATNAELEEFGDERVRAVIEAVGDGDGLFEAMQDRHRAFVADAVIADDLTVVEVLITEDLRTRAAALDVSASPSFRLTFEADAQLLRRHAPEAWLADLFDKLPVFEVQPNARQVFVELFHNAIDHGLLALDSGVKAQPQGFQTYYALREDRLRTLSSGRVRCEVELQPGDPAQLVVRVEDSGAGFDPNEVIADESALEMARTYGRGLALARRLSRSLSFTGTGSRVQATFDY